MNPIRFRRIELARILLSAFFCMALAARAEPGFISLFDGRTLNGWRETHKTPGPSYYVTNGVIASPTNAANDLITDGVFADYILRLDFKLTPGANNGVGIRVPFETNDLTYSGNEVQILDDGDAQYARLDPGQYCGSLYKIFAARRGALNRVGEWNHYEITAIGRRIKVALNGQTIVDGSLNDVTNREILRGHPGMLRESGHIALLGHWAHVEFRNIYVKELPRLEKDNTPPEGFTRLFDGRNLNGWKGRLAAPLKRADVPGAQFAIPQSEADKRMRKHWKVRDGELIFDGRADNLCTSGDYRDFELLVDWKVRPKGEGCILLRGTPEVQMLATNTPGQSVPPEGSGGLWSNRQSHRHPMLFADKPAGEWNRFRILVVGDRAHVFLNGQLVVRDTALENYWEPDKPLYSAGPIELQGINSALSFKNIYVREIPSVPAK
jgi:hypothetical protein